MSKGIDIPVDSLLALFNSDLWTENSNKSFYGRVFRNERRVPFPSLISPEIWVSGTDYIEVLKDTKYDAQCFFDLQPNQQLEGDVFTANVWLCFMVNLQELYPLLTRTEATQQVERDVKDLVLLSEFDITNLISGFEGFTGYDWGRDIEIQPKADMSPHYVFRYDLSIEYVNSNC